MNDLSGDMYSDRKYMSKNTTVIAIILALNITKDFSVFSKEDSFFGLHC